MGIDWQELLNQALQALLVLAIPFVYWQFVKVVNAFAKRAGAYSDAHDFGVLDAAIEAAVQWAEVYCRELKGVDKLRIAVAKVEDITGWQVDEAEVERVYQRLRKYDELAPAPTPAPVAGGA